MLKQNYQRGFTLIELMSVVIIVAILASIAYPSYENYIHKSRKENARADLIENVRNLENYYNRNKSFNGFNSLSQNRSKDYFTLTGKYDDNSYQLIAKPTKKNKGEKQSIVYSSTDGTMLCNSDDLTDCSRPF